VRREAEHCLPSVESSGSSFVGGLLAGHSVQFAAAVSCPVPVGFGDHDILQRPRDDAGHLWDRIGAWAAGLSSYLRATDAA
jgi:hypothetical protein